MKIKIPMSEDKMCIAWFKKKIKNFILTTKAEPPEGGTISEGGTYPVGTNVDVTITPNPDWEIDYIEGLNNKWRGLGMGTFQDYESYIQTILDNGFIEIRIDIPSYQRTQRVADSKAMVIRTIAKGAKVIWGVSSNSKNNPDYTITAANWPTYRQAILDNAQWAQDNGVYEFQLGNEEETHNDDTTLTDAQLITNLKDLATEVKAIFTNGNVSYSTDMEFYDDWIATGKGDIDILACNIYRGHDGVFNDNWKTAIDALVNAFGVDGTYITEFNLSWQGLDDYSTDEAVQATAISEMINYIKASGMTRAIYFQWKNEAFGVVRGDGTYRDLLLDVLLNSK